MAEWYVYAIGIFAAGLGLLLVYIILNKMKIVGDIPILSNIVNPIIYGQSRQGIYRGKTKFMGKNLNTKIITGSETDLELEPMGLLDEGRSIIIVDVRDGSDRRVEKTLDAFDLKKSMDTGDVVQVNIWNPQKTHMLSRETWWKGKEIDPKTYEFKDNIVYNRADNTPGMFASAPGEEPKVSSAKNFVVLTAGLRAGSEKDARFARMLSMLNE